MANLGNGKRVYQGLQVINPNKIKDFVKKDLGFNIINDSLVLSSLLNKENNKVIYAYKEK